jgi:hypothetical protein
MPNPKIKLHPRGVVTVNLGPTMKELEGDEEKVEE